MMKRISLKKLSVLINIIAIVAVALVLSSCGTSQEKDLVVQEPTVEVADEEAHTPPEEPEEEPNEEPKEQMPEEEVVPPPPVEESNNEPQKTLEGLFIGIDAGHQTHGNSSQEPVFPGASETKAKVSSGTAGVSSGLSEYELNLDVALKLQAVLESKGAEILMVRTENDVDISNVERATMMNDAGVDLCLRIHANGGDSSASGAMMLVPGADSTKNIEFASVLAGEIIFESYLAETGAKDLGVIYRNDLSGFNWLEVPGCLIEMGFMTNHEEDLLMASPEYQEKIVAGLTKGIEKWYAETMQ